MPGKKNKAEPVLSKNDKIRHILTRLAVAQVLIIFGIWEIVQPVYWNSFVPTFVSSFMNINLFLFHPKGAFTASYLEPSFSYMYSMSLFASERFRY